MGLCAVLLAAAAFIGCFKSVVSGRRLDENCWPPDWADLLTGNFQRKGFRPFVCRANVEQRPRERLSNVLKKIFFLEVYCSVSFIAWQWFGSNSTRKVFKMTAWKRRPIDSLIHLHEGTVEVIFWLLMSGFYWILQISDHWPYHRAKMSCPLGWKASRNVLQMWRHHAARSLLAMHRE